jgi:hypothetical protein
MAVDGEKYVMLSYSHKGKSIVNEVYNSLRAENIPVWFDENDMHNNLYDRYISQYSNSFYLTVCLFR